MKLKTFPLRVEDIGYIIPMGNLQSGHTTPSDHLYFVPKGAANQASGNGRGAGVDTRDFSQLYDVVAVADGSVFLFTSKGHLYQFHEGAAGGVCVLTQK